MEKNSEKPKRKIDRSKKKRKLRSKSSFDAALGHKDLRTKSHGASHKRLYGKIEQVELDLPENRTYEMPSSSEEDDEDFSDLEDEIIVEEKFDLSNLQNKTLNTELTELEIEYFEDIRLDTDKTCGSEEADTVDKTPCDVTKGKKETDGKDEEQEEDNLDSLLKLENSSHTSTVKSLRFVSSSVYKPKWRSGDKKISELEMYLDSILDDT